VVFGSLPKIFRAIREAGRGGKWGGPGRWGRLRERARNGEETAAEETAWSAMEPVDVPVDGVAGGTGAVAGKRGCG
jgi:hypothetical protein